MKDQSGLTLVEILVVIGIFSGIITLISGIFVSTFEMHRKTLAVQRTTGELGYMLEYMSKSIRMAQIDEDGSCVDQGHTYNYDSSSNSIQFINYEDRCLEYFLDDGVIKVRNIEGNNEVYDLTSGMISINSFHATVTPEDTSELFKKQPSITLYFEVKELETSWWKTEIQSTITRRGLDVERNL